LGTLSKHDIAIDGRDGRDDTGARAPEVLFTDGRGAIGLLLIGTLFDADPAVGIACGLAIFAEAIEHGLALVVFFDPGVEVLHINGDDLAQARDFGLGEVIASSGKT